ncbi:MAG: SPOR domain-containing protein [Flavobacteriaceae bacterium]
MQLSKAITNLLYRHDCVTIPGFGSFIINESSAKYIEKENKFYPPGKFVSFNPLIKSNDGLLANYISTKKSISYEESLNKIHSRVIKWKKILSQESLYIQGIGEFILNDSENIIFTADKNLNFSRESFGLSPIKVQMLEKSVLTYNKKTLEKYNSLTVKKKPLNIPVPLRNAAIFILLLAGAYFTNTNYQEFVFKNEIEQNKIERENLITNLEKAVFNLGELPALIINIESKAEQNFYIIAGAFSSAINADRLVSGLAKKGYNSTKFPKNNEGLIRVSFGSFNTKEDAVIALRSIRDNENKYAWILTKTN